MTSSLRSKVETGGESVMLYCSDLIEMGAPPCCGSCISDDDAGFESGTFHDCDAFYIEGCCVHSRWAKDNEAAIVARLPLPRMGDGE